MKKISLILLVVLILSIVLIVGGCSGEKNETATKMCTDWSAYLNLNEKALSCQNDSLAFAADYCENRKWDDLVRARSSAVYTKEILTAYADRPIEQEMTSDDYKKLTDLGMDLQDVQTEINIYNKSTLETIKNVNVPVWSGYILNLMELFYSDNDVKLLKDYVTNKREYINLQAQYLYLINQFVLLELPDGNASELKKWCKENCPLIMGSCSKSYSDTNAVLNAMSSILDQIEQLDLKLQEYNTEQQVVYNQEYQKLTEMQAEASKLSEKVDQGKLSEEEASKSIIASQEKNFSGLDNIIGKPELVLSYPTCGNMDESEWMYYWKDDNNNVTAITYPFDLKEIPSSFNMEIPDVTELDFYNYALYLVDCGLPVLDKNDTAIMFQIGDNGKLTVRFEDNTLQVHTEKTQVCFVNASYLLTKQWCKDKTDK